MINVSLNFENNTMNIGDETIPILMVDDPFLAAMAPDEEDEAAEYCGKLSYHHGVELKIGDRIGFRHGPSSATGIVNGFDEAGFAIVRHQGLPCFAVWDREIEHYETRK